MTKKTISIIVTVAVVALIAVVWYWYAVKNVSMNGVPGTVAVGAHSVTLGMATSSTRAAVPANIAVPNEGAANVALGVAVPVVQGAGDSSGNVSYRSFNIDIQNGSFSPDTVIVKQGDTVDLELTAVNAGYEFTQPDYGFNTPIAKGTTQRIQFQALQSGNFIFYCASCGGPSKGPVGHLIVVASS